MFGNSYRISDPSLRQEVVDRKWAVKCQSNFLCEKPWSNEFLTLHLILGTPVKIISLKANEVFLYLDLSHQKVVDIKPSNSVFIDTIFAKQPRESNQVWERLRKKVRIGVHQFTVSCRLKTELRKSLRQRRSVKYAKENENKWIKLIWSPR